MARHEVVARIRNVLIVAALVGGCVAGGDDPGQVEQGITAPQVSMPAGGYASWGGWAGGNYDRNADTFDNAGSFGAGGFGGVGGNYDRNAPNFESNGGAFGGGGFSRVGGNYDRNDATFQGDPDLGLADPTVGAYTRANTIYLVADPSPARVNACGVDALGNPVYCDIDGSEVTPTLALGFTFNQLRADGSYQARRPAFLRGDTLTWEVIGPGEAFVLPLLITNGWGRAFPVKVRFEYQGGFYKTFPDGSMLSTEWPLYYVQYGYVDQVVNGVVVPCQPGQCPMTERWRGAYEYPMAPILPPDRPRAQGGTWSIGEGWQIHTMPFATEGGHQPGLGGKAMVGMDAPPDEQVVSTAGLGCATTTTGIYAPFAMAYGNGWETTTWTGVRGEKEVSVVFFLTTTGQAVAVSAYPADGTGNFALASGGQLPRLQRDPRYEHDGTLGNLGSFVAPGATALSGVSAAHGANRVREVAFAAKDPDSEMRNSIYAEFERALTASGGARSTYRDALDAAASSSCSTLDLARDAIIAFSPQGQVLAANGASSTVLAGCDPNADVGRCDPIWYYERHQANCGDGICDYFVGENLCDHPNRCDVDCHQNCLPPHPPPPPPDQPDAGSIDEPGEDEPGEDEGHGPRMTDEMVGDALDGEGANGPNDDDAFTIDPEPFDSGSGGD